MISNGHKVLDSESPDRICLGPVSPADTGSLEGRRGGKKSIPKKFIAHTA